MPHVVRAPHLLVILLVACSGAERPPAPAAKEAPAPADGPADGSASPPPAGEPASPYPAGVVPRYEDITAVTEAPASPLSEAASCVDRPTECELLPGVLGFHPDGRVALLEAPRIASCGEGEPIDLTARVTRSDAPGGGTVTAFKPTEADPDGRAQAWRFVSERAAEGFTAPAQLVDFTADVTVGIRSVVALAGLKAPLAGWLLHAKHDAGEAAIELVDPTNKTAIALGTLASGESRPGLVQVALDPAGTHVFVTVARSDGSHCGEDAVSLHRWPLPASAVAAR